MLFPSVTGQDKRYWLLTGSTGLVGEYLLRDLLVAGFPVAVLVRHTKKATAAARIEAIMQRWERQMQSELPRPVVLVGDVKAPGLGLADSELLWVKQRVGHLLHNAAVLKFFGPCRSGDPWQTNVVGTQNVLDFIQANEIPDLHFVSTAYVSGRQVQPVREDDFPDVPTFRNDYEHSKWVAEGLVRSASLPKPPTIYRPVVIAGDSESGYTSTFHGLYLYLRTMALLVPQQQRDAAGRIVTPIRLPMRGDVSRNIVPVQWVSQVIAHLLGTTHAHGKTFHLAPEQGITPNELIQYCYEYFGSTGVEFCPEMLSPGQEENEFASKVFDAIRIYQDYDNSDPKFDTTNLKKYAGHLECPALTQDVITRYLEFGERSRWGKSKSALPDMSLSGWECVQRLSEEIGELIGHLPLKSGAGHTVSFQLLGPGGGPFTIIVPGTQAGPSARPQVLSGLVQQPSMLLQMSTRSLQQWLASDFVQRKKTTALWLQRRDLVSS